MLPSHAGTSLVAKNLNLLTTAHHRLNIVISLENIKGGWSTGIYGWVPDETIISDMILHTDRIVLFRSDILSRNERNEGRMGLKLLALKSVWRKC